MAINCCPACLSKAPPDLIVEISNVAQVNYYRCLLCWHVWTTTKDNQSFVSHVTALPEPGEQYELAAARNLTLLQRSANDRGGIPQTIEYSHQLDLNRAVVLRAFLRIKDGAWDLTRLEGRDGEWLKDWRPSKLPCGGLPK